MSKTNSTGLMLSEARGLLKNLLDNLSGEHCNYWLESLKKMLRKEEIPTPPIEVLEVVQAKNKSKEKIDLLIKFLESVPVVKEVEVGSFNGFVFLYISVHANVLSFAGLQDRVYNYAQFSLLHDSSVEYNKNYRLTRNKENKIFYDFLTDYGEKYKNIEEFSKALYDLGIIYQKYIPEVPNL